MEAVSEMKKSRSPIDQIEFMRNLLAFLLVGAFIGAIGAFTFFTIPAENKEILTYMIGQLSGMALTALGFYFINKVGQDALDATRSANTGKLADLAKTALDASKPADEQIAEAVDETADAAVNKAEELKGETK